MPIQIQYFEIAETVAPTSDLSAFLKPSAVATLKVSVPPEMKGLTLGNAPTGPIRVPFTTDQELAWDLGDQGNVTFSFAPKITAVIQIQNSGELFSYNLGEDESDNVSIPVPSGMAYVSILLNVSISVSSGPGFSAGNLGVTAQVDAGTTFALSYRKAFPSSTPVFEAIKKTFDSFVLPFQPETVSKLGDKDFLDYEFFGRIGTGFGITYGVSGTLVAGRSVSEIEKSLSFGNLGQTIVNHIPTFQAGAAFAVEYEHDDTFRIIIGRQTSSATMAVFRRRDKIVSTTATVGALLVHSTSSDIAANLEASAGQFGLSVLLGLCRPEVFQTSPRIR